MRFVLRSCSVAIYVLALESAISPVWGDGCQCNYGAGGCGKPSRCSKTHRWCHRNQAYGNSCGSGWGDGGWGFCGQPAVCGAPGDGAGGYGGFPVGMPVVPADLTPFGLSAPPKNEDLEKHFKTIEDRLKEIVDKLDEIKKHLPKGNENSLSTPGLKHPPSINTSHGRTISAETKSGSPQDFIAASIRGWDDYARHKEAAKKRLPTGESPTLTKAN